MQKGTGFYHPRQQPIVIHLENAAINVLTDFKFVPPEKITADMFAHDALNEMNLTKVHSLLVTDGKDEIIGLIISKDIQGAQLTKIANASKIKITEVTVAMLMKPCDKILTIDLKNLSNARVGHIVKIMHDHSLSYLLVKESVDDSGEEIVRGIFSARQISKQLGFNISGDLSASTVADINKRVG
ncbi:MAG: hypothetical protein COB50_03390 [Thiotrichales bacterium]|nr:MAG: hypothetical protein COB50_03390 [Thiotrichales bacterium]